MHDPTALAPLLNSGILHFTSHKTTTLHESFIQGTLLHGSWRHGTTQYGKTAVDDISLLEKH
jgi:hypothetical protein